MFYFIINHFYIPENTFFHIAVSSYFSRTKAAARIFASSRFVMLILFLIRIP